MDEYGGYLEVFIPRSEKEMRRLKEKQCNGESMEEVNKMALKCLGNDDEGNLNNMEELRENPD
jgi:hypothetical protein